MTATGLAPCAYRVVAHFRVFPEELADTPVVGDVGGRQGVALRMGVEVVGPRPAGRVGPVAGEGGECVAYTVWKCNAYRRWIGRHA